MIKKIKEAIEDGIIIYQEGKRIAEKKEHEKELNNQINMGTVNQKQYNIIHNILKPHKACQVIQGQVYVIEGQHHKEQILFDCLQSGSLMIHYNFINGEDIFSFGGTAKLKCNEELTKGFGE